jgi:tetratricopeptide (TPR) repeat protein
MTARLTASVREAPATVPALAALALCIVWATDQAGYPVTHWAPGGLILLGLLVIATLALRRPPTAVSVPVRVALGCLAAYTAFSYLSILWAAAPGDALEGADRTLLYLLVFALFAGWAQRGVTAAALLLIWTLSIVGLALFVLLHIDGASASQLPALLPGGRLAFPSGYANANAAEWMMGFWPAVLMARERRLPWALRGLLAGGAVILADVTLLSQSRGSLYATPAMLILVFALLPKRTRTFALLVPVAAAIAATTPAVLRVGDHLREGLVVRATLQHAVGDALLAGLVVALLVAAGSAMESRRTLSSGEGRLLHRLTAAAAIATLLAVLAVGLAAAGDPVHRVEHAWQSFKGGYGEGRGPRLLSGLGSNRYDFFRVSLDEFEAHPVGGIGVDNFQQQYLRKGKSAETPRYPHSVELRTLAQTGVIGALLAIAGLGAALIATLRAARGPDRLGAAVASAALAGFGYWVVHGSVDWFWEFAGLGAPAFALLGLACALDPARRARQADPDAPPGPGAPLDPHAPPGPDAPPDPAPRGAPAQAARPAFRLPVVPRTAWLAAGALPVIAAALAFAGPWLSQLQVQTAAREWPTDRSGAYGRLDQAAALDPLGDQPYLVAGSIALRLGELGRADEQFAKALGRVPEDAYAALERGAIASTLGRRAEARRLLARAASLDPRDPLTREALRLVDRGRGVSVQALNRLILEKARELV